MGPRQTAPGCSCLWACQAPVVTSCHPSQQSRGQPGARHATELWASPLLRCHRLRHCAHAPARRCQLCAAGSSRRRCLCCGAACGRPTQVRRQRLHPPHQSPARPQHTAARQQAQPQPKQRACPHARPAPAQRAAARTAPGMAHMAVTNSATADASAGVPTNPAATACHIPHSTHASQYPAHTHTQTHTVAHLAGACCGGRARRPAAIAAAAPCFQVESTSCITVLVTAGGVLLLLPPPSPAHHARCQQACAQQHGRHRHHDGSHDAAWHGRACAIAQRHT
jgi:hypothetical protein